MNNILDTQVANSSKVFGKTNTFLLNSVLALFHRGYLGSYDKEFKSVTLETLELIEDPGQHFETSISYANDILTGVITELCSLEEKVSSEWLTIRLKPLKVDHFEFITVITEEFKSISEKSEEEIKSSYKIYRELCNKYKEGYLVKSVARTLFGSVLNQNEMGAKDELLSAIDKITPLLSRDPSFGIGNIPGISGYIRSSDEEAVREQFRLAAEVVDKRSVLKCGIQGWDNGMSDYGGLLRGTVVELQAISGGSKSDTARCYLNGVARTTTPHLFDDSKKPALVYLTLEDTLARSVSRTFQQMRMEDEDKFDVEELSDEESYGKYRETVEKNGYTVFSIKGKQKELTPSNVLQMLQAIMDEGYEIHLFVMDYIGLLSFADIEEANNSEAIKTGYSYVFNFCQENRIGTILCAQIAGKAYEKVKESAESDGIKDLVNVNLSSQSMNVINVIDVRIMVNVVVGSSRAFHQFAVGKNRFGTAQSLKDKYAVYEMHRALDSRDGLIKPAGFVKRDVGGPSKALRATPPIGMDEESISF